MPKGKPNILVIWGDDIGITNLSCYSDGLMGYRTPNIDRIANEGGAPKLFNLRTDPFERADVTSNTYWDWYLSKAYGLLGAQAIVQGFLATFKDFPARQKAASFTIDQIMEKMTAGH